MFETQGGRLFIMAFCLIALVGAIFVFAHQDHEVILSDCESKGGVLLIMRNLDKVCIKKEVIIQ